MKKCISLFLILAIVLVSGTAFSAPRTLTFLHYNDIVYPRFHYALAQFQKQHPDVKIRMLEEDGQEDVVQQLARTSDVDIVYLDQNQLMESARAGAILSLDAAPKILQELQKNEWLPFEALLSNNGRLYGIPDTARSSLWGFDAAAAQAIGFQLPQYPYTWQDILTAALEIDWQKAGAPCLMRTSFAYPDFVMDYLSWQYASTGAADFSEEEFSQALICFQTLVLLGAIEDSRGAASRPCVFTRTPDNVHAVQVKNPVIGDCPCVTVDMTAFAISKNSKNLDLAADFLTILASYECQTKEYAYADSMLLKDGSGYSVPDSDETDFHRPSQDLRLFVAENWIPRFAETAFVQYLNDTQIIARYLTNDAAMPLEQLLSLLQDKGEHS